MSDWLDPVIYFIGSGDAFFAGAAAILFGLVVSVLTPARWLLLTRNLMVLVGAILVAISGTPLPYWMYALLGVVTCTWLVLEWWKARVGVTTLISARLVLALSWLGAVGMELPYHFTPTLPALGRPTLFLIGDSVSAGMRDNEKRTWPKLLADEHAIDVRDFSKMGATVGSALKQSEQIGDQAGFVLLEIGGNDLLGSTSAEQYEERLDALLAAVCRHDRAVVMIELPLPPFRNDFGMIQRRLAAQYDVMLIPKRVFIGVLTTRGATIDGIHLSPSGHARMAEVVWQEIRPAYPE